MSDDRAKGRPLGRLTEPRSCSYPHFCYGRNQNDNNKWRASAWDTRIYSPALARRVFPPTVILAQHDSAVVVYADRGVDAVSSNTWYIPARVSSVALVAIFVMFYPSLLCGMVGTARACAKGGLFGEAEILAKSISQHGLDSYVKRECSSACTFVFLAGKHRCVAEGARIGFHAASYVRDLSRKTFQDVADYQRDLYLEAGLSGPFVSSIMETPDSRVWYPSRQQLFEARVTTPDCQ
jgi:hypothetical protein